MQWKLPLFKLNYNYLEKKAVDEVIKSNWLSMGEKTIELEKMFDDTLGVKSKSLAVSSCTAALHLSLIASGVNKNSEVIVPSLSFVAQLNVIKNLGAKAILVDCKSLADWNMNNKVIKKKITSKTKAIIILHYAGYPNLINKELLNICKQKNIKIIEDVAHAPGASINNKFCGTFGDFGCFSFFSNKNISAGEGGLVVTKKRTDYNKLKLLRSHGMNKISLDKIKGRTAKYDVSEYGLNYRIDEIRASLAIQQLKKLKKANRLRKKNVFRYIKYLKNTKYEIPFQELEDNIKAVYHIFVLLVPKNLSRDGLIKFLKNHGVQSSIHYPKFWGFKAYEKEFSKKHYPICNEICDRAVTLPLYPDMLESDIKLVCMLLRDYLNGK